MISRAHFISLLAGTTLALLAMPSQAAGREEARILTATQVLDELRASRDQFIPDRLLERAYGIAVVPDVAKVAFVAGGRRGKGVLVVRDKDGRFTSPVFITLTGGSFGWQAGVQESDIVLVFTTRAGIEGITDGKLTLGRRCLGRRGAGGTAGIGQHRCELRRRGVLLFAGPRTVRGDCARRHGAHDRPARQCEFLSQGRCVGLRHHQWHADQQRCAHAAFSGGDRLEYGACVQIGRSGCCSACDTRCARCTGHACSAAGPAPLGGRTELSDGRSAAGAGTEIVDRSAQLLAR